ncbi:hypothetical protein HYPSUDRAFT_917547 [Hypholoma sublateritium FD-334 SS-4]|uniref:Uncharacterized protein n=1 Tax=Hypholoma sublateritium (strain FD-334 SS-4) TaxID=945553 RepID=A0A0D2NIR1_HYPSF|nr:hypothetical protein HYPSUDRAFT_917547 [Hypholoma sublateritium FD-334 SS-4]
MVRRRAGPRTFPLRHSSHRAETRWRRPGAHQWSRLYYICTLRRGRSGARDRFALLLETERGIRPPLLALGLPGARALASTPPLRPYAPPRASISRRQPPSPTTVHRKCPVASAPRRKHPSPHPRILPPEARVWPPRAARRRDAYCRLRIPRACCRWSSGR